MLPLCTPIHVAITKIYNTSFMLLQADAGTTHVDGQLAFVFQNPDHQILMPSVGADVAFGLGRCTHLSDQYELDRGLLISLACVAAWCWLKVSASSLSPCTRWRQASAFSNIHASDSCHAQQSPVVITLGTQLPTQDAPLRSHERMPQIPVISLLHGSSEPSQLTTTTCSFHMRLHAARR